MVSQIKTACLWHFTTAVFYCNGETYFWILTSDLEKSGHSNTPEPSALTPTFCGLTSPWTNPCWCNKLRPHVTPRAIFCLLWKPNKLACFKFYTQKLQQQIKNPLIFINKQIFHILISKNTISSNPGSFIKLSRSCIGSTFNITYPIRSF